MGRLRIPGPLGRLLGPLDALLGGEMLVTPLGDFKRLSTLRMRGSQVTGSAGDLELDRNPFRARRPTGSATRPRRRLSPSRIRRCPWT